MKRKIKFWSFVLIVISGIFLVGTTNSRYISEISSNSVLNIAIPQISLDDSSMASTELLFPGDSQTFEFLVKNYENSKINEVLMRYYIKVNLTNSEIPLTYKIYSVSGTNETELSQTTEGFGPITLNYGTQEEKHYKITFTWDEDKNDVQYANKEYSFNLEINATQEI